MLKSTTIGDIGTNTAARLLTAVVLVMLGTFLIYGTGFAGASALHNAAHDTRHSLAFPCH